MASFVFEEVKTNDTAQQQSASPATLATNGLYTGRRRVLQCERCLIESIALCSVR